MKMVQRMFQIRTCRIEIDGNLPRPCLYFDMHACLGPCVASLTTKAAYGEAVRDVLLFLSGRNDELALRLRSKMEAAASDEGYEMAAAYRDCLRTVEELAQKQRVQSLAGEDVDVFGDFIDDGNLAVSVLHVRGGTVLDTRELFWEGIGDVDQEEFWVALLSQYYDATTFLPREVHLPDEVSQEALAPVETWLSERRGARVEVRTPKRGAAFDRVKIARDNARTSHVRRFKTVREAGEMATLALAKALDLDHRPARIECFDISHLQGSDTYASCVVFVDGKPAKGEYRVFRIDRPVPDDFASIAEAVTRRYERRRAEGEGFPDLLVIDGGKGQLSAALAALDRIGIELPAVGLAKREEEVFVPGRSLPVVLPRRHAGLKLLQRARDEAHRFGLMHHRKARTRRTLTSPLLEIPGLGPATARRLLAVFGNAEAVLAATSQALAAAAGKASASRIERWRASREDKGR
jgi:excinuclease ABC subunit C